MRKIIFFLGLIILITLAGLFLKSNFLSAEVATIKISNAFCVSESDLRSQLHLSSQKLPILNEADLRDKILKAYPCVRAVSVKKTFPNKIEISLSGRMPVAILDFIAAPEQNNLPDLPDDVLEATPSSQSAIVLKDPEEIITKASASAQFLTDDQGYIYSHEVSNLNVPEFLYGAEALDVGQKIDGSSITKSLAILTQLKSDSVSIQGTPLIFGDSLRIDNSNYGKLSFSLSKDLSKELASLQLILATVKIDSGSFSGGNTSGGFESIDLRFDKPVVVYQKKKG